MDDFINYKLYKYDKNWEVVKRYFQEQNKLNTKLLRQNRRLKIFSLIVVYFLYKHDKEIFALKTKVSSLRKDVNELTNDFGE
jgi:hypothetical protein